MHYIPDCRRWYFSLENMANLTLKIESVSNVSFSNDVFHVALFDYEVINTCPKCLLSAVEIGALTIVFKNFIYNLQFQNRHSKIYVVLVLG